MSTFLRYVFEINPRGVEYTSSSVLIALGICAALIALSFGIRFWRRSQDNAILRKLSRSWSSVAFWFGLIGLLLVVSRVEGIQFVAMRFWWGVWATLLLVFAILQWRLFRMRYYVVIPSCPVEDPRDKYLPRPKR